MITSELRVKARRRAYFIHPWPIEFMNMTAWWCRYTSDDSLKGKSLLEYLDENIPEQWRETKEDEPPLFHSPEDTMMRKHGLDDRNHPLQQSKKYQNDWRKR